MRSKKSENSLQLVIQEDSSNSRYFENFEAAEFETNFATQ